VTISFYYGVQIDLADTSANAASEGLLISLSSIIYPVDFELDGSTYFTSEPKQHQMQLDDV
jgi:hypothetical protein